MSAGASRWSTWTAPESGWYEMGNGEPRKLTAEEADKVEEERRKDAPVTAAHNHPPGTDHPDGIHGCHACAIEASAEEPRDGYTEWCVWYGGDDPNDCAGIQVFGAEAEAEAMEQWISGGRVAKRTVTRGLWQPVGPAPLDHLNTVPDPAPGSGVIG